MFSRTNLVSSMTRLNIWKLRTGSVGFRELLIDLLLRVESDIQRITPLTARASSCIKLGSFHYVVYMALTAVLPAASDPYVHACASTSCIERRVWLMELLEYMS